MKTPSSYELPHRIHTVKTYPIQSPNGSTVIIYGQENGVKIAWRGGRAFKAPCEPSVAPKSKANGTHDAIVLLDSDEEDTPSSPPFEDTPEFEDEEEDFDPLSPYPNILQVLDLYFGTDVLHLALLPAAVLRAEGSPWRGIQPLKQKIVFTATCADNSVRFVTLPLTPPSPTSKARLDFRSDFTAAHAGNGKWGEKVVMLNGHQKPSAGVSMTVETKSDSKSAAEPCIVVASHSREVTGLLLLFRISITSPKPNILPFQMIHLSTPARKIAFNPSISEPRSSRLLVADTTGVCRIYDFKVLVKGQILDEPVENPAAEQGSWLLSLYPGFQKDANNGVHTGFGRKTIIDANWVVGGCAIVVLLNDGEWAIWDIEGVGPGASQGLLGRQPIRGGSRSAYSIAGWIDSPVKPPGPPQITSSANKFAPMTPGTRKTVDLFSNKAHSGSSHGKISVLELPSTSPTNPTEESIVFWLGDSFAIIPSLSKYWATHSRKGGGSGNLFNSTPGGRLIRLEGIDLQGERCTGIDQIP